MRVQRPAIPRKVLPAVFKQEKVAWMRSDPHKRGWRVVRARFGTIKKPSSWLEFPGSFARSR